MLCPLLLLSAQQFLPRKFKVAVTVPGDNSVDILTNDIGVVVITDPATGELQGFDLLVGGGMGRTHRCVGSVWALGRALVVGCVCLCLWEEGARALTRCRRAAWAWRRTGVWVVCGH